MKRLVLIVVLLALLGAGLGAAMAWRWWQEPLPLAAESVEFTVDRGQTSRAIAQGWVEAGVQTQAEWLHWAFRLSGQAHQIRAGSYAIQRGDSPERLLNKMVRGEETLEQVRFLEGWTFAQAREVLAKAPGLRQTLTGKSDLEVMAALGVPNVPAEGRFFPDTYRYGRGVSDLVVLKQAWQAQQALLDQAWAQRAENSPLRTPDELLTLASIVEKETGREADRALVAGVFINRMRIGMRLQTDPTVIYGLGARFDGNLRKVDLLTDTPFNTYTRAGLPPTPIALPSQASLLAAARPASTKALYFVARGDGSSEFSETLEAHNRAVNRYQR
jgi:UPF0755 protein